LQDFERNHLPGGDVAGAIEAAGRAFANQPLNMVGLDLLSHEIAFGFDQRCTTNQTI
jgi:hypothetical protein